MDNMGQTVLSVLSLDQNLIETIAKFNIDQIFACMNLCARKSNKTPLSSTPMLFRGCVCYIFASVYFMSKREHL